MTTKKITSMGKSLNKERTGSQSSCDFTITCGNREFKVHKCVMGLISEYFKKMFTSSQPAANQEKTVLKDIEADSMEMLLDYVYNDESVIKEHNVYEILEVAEFFQIPSVKTDCDQFLQAHISIFNCLRHWMMARKFSLNVSWYHDYVSKHFGTIMTFGEGLKIDFGHFNSLLKMKRQGSSIDRKNSLMSFQIMWRWVKYDIVERKQYFRALFSQVNLKWVFCKIMQKELDDELLSEFPDCAAKLREALELYKPCSSYDLHSVNHIKFLYPNPENKIFDDENFDFKDFTEFNEHSLVVAKDEIIYSIGGRNGGQSKSLFGVRRLNPHRMQLGVCRDLNFGRRNAGCAIYKDSIYVAGGLEHDSFTQSSVEYLSNNESCWKFKQGMDMQREGLSLVAHEDKLYAISGRPRPGVGNLLHLKSHFNRYSTK
ncbi:kelch-like protein 7 [Clavelina lepadiformis]|uniref:kelch-like protein 7 n=1 Tax=Clavelina lepadiformis TaxID=159417 RepID=UPI004042857A